VREKSSIVLEFFGLAGSGKSTLCAHIYKFLEEEGVRVLKPMDEVYIAHNTSISKSLYYSKVFFSNLRRSIKYGKLIFISKQKRFNSIIGLLTVLLARSVEMQKCNDNFTVYLFDEGVFQLLWSIGFDSKRKDLITFFEKVTSVMKMPDIVIIVNSSMDKAINRIIDRGKCDRMDLILPYDSGGVSRALELHQILKHIIKINTKKKAHMEVFQINNEFEVDIENNALKIVEIIRSRFMKMTKKCRH
jgi:thymidylate kinase